MTNLIAAFFFATLRIHVIYLMVMHSDALLDTKIFFSTIFDPLSKCPTLLSFFLVFRDRITPLAPEFFLNFSTSCI